MLERRVRVAMGVAVALLFWACGAQGQVSAASPAVAAHAGVTAFDVISIKPNDSGDRPSIDAGPGSFSASGVSLKMLILYVYGVKDDQLIGLPKWGDSSRFDIEAKLVAADANALHALTREQSRAMQEAILTDRFQLKVHRETKVLPVYELVIGKSGPKFQASTMSGEQRGANGLRAGAVHTNNHGGNADMSSTAVGVGVLVNVLARETERIVVDRTGLTGLYDLNLTWSRDEGGNATADSNSPSLFTALEEQLGLKLRAAKSPVEVVVVDRAEVPVGN